MALTHSTGLRNFILDSGLKTAFNTNGRINIYSGSPPAADNAATGTLLGTLTLSATAFAAATGGASVAAAITDDSNADASATAGYFMMYLSTETAPGSAAGSTDKRLLGTITATGGGGDMTFDVIAFIANGTIHITGFTYNYPA